MDNFISKLKSTVSEVLPGNPLSGDFCISNVVVTTAGPGLTWKVYNATKKNTKQPASVFVFEKKSLDKMSKDEKNQVQEVMKRGIQQLTRLRHPKILSVLHPMEENRECLAFATEPVLGSLAHMIQSSPSSAIEHPKLDETEIRYGMLQLMEALTFLHDDVKLVHGNLTPASVIINTKNMWKLCGFEFCVPNTGTSTEPSHRAVEWRNQQVPNTQPFLDFLAPEWGVKCQCDTRSDLFSLGILIHTLYNQGKPLFQCHDSITAYKQHASELSRLKASAFLNIPRELKDTYALLLSADPATRPHAKFVLKNPYFDDIGVMTLVYMDSLVQRDNLERSQYFKNLPNVIRQLPKSLLLRRVLPALFDECSKLEMIPFVLQNILIVAEGASKLDYAEKIFPGLARLFAIFDPIQIPLLLMKNMSLLLEKTDSQQTRLHIVPMLLRSIEINDNPHLQELCLSIIPNFAHLIETLVMKTGLVPRIKHLAVNTQVQTVRVQCIECLGKIIEHIDKWFVIEEILTFLKDVPNREPAVIMSLVGICKVAFTHKNLGLSKDVLATKVLPFLLPLSVDRHLSKQQFCTVMTLIKGMVKTVEKEQMEKLIQQEEENAQKGGKKMSGDPPAGMEEFLRGAGLGADPQVKKDIAKTPETKPTVTPPKISAPPKTRDLTSTLGTPLVKPVASVPPMGVTTTPAVTVKPDQRSSSTPGVVTASKPTAASTSIDWGKASQPTRSTLTPQNGIAGWNTVSQPKETTANATGTTINWGISSLPLTPSSATSGNTQWSPSASVSQSSLMSPMNSGSQFSPNHSTGLQNPSTRPPGSMGIMSPSHTGHSPAVSTQNPPSRSLLSQNDINDLLG